MVAHALHRTNGPSHVSTRRPRETAWSDAGSRLGMSRIRGSRAASPRRDMESFQPRVPTWFQGRLGAPTGSHRCGCLHVVADDHTLITSPTTGSAKTNATQKGAATTFVAGRRSHAAYRKSLRLNDGGGCAEYDRTRPPGRWCFTGRQWE